MKTILGLEFPVNPALTGIVGGNIYISFFSVPREREKKERLIAIEGGFMSHGSPKNSVFQTGLGLSLNQFENVTSSEESICESFTYELTSS